MATVAHTMAKAPSRLLSAAMPRQPAITMAPLPVRSPPWPVGTPLDRLNDKAYFDAAAARFGEGVRRGMNADDMVAAEFGQPSAAAMTESQAKFKDAVKEKLAARAAELATVMARRARNVEAGKRAYEVGDYQDAVALLSKGADDVGADTEIGGDAQIWLALAYQAVGREEDALQLYSILDDHPIKKVRKQAGDLKYILEAPKLAIGENEVVTIPQMSSDTWSRPRGARGGTASSLQQPVGVSRFQRGDDKARSEQRSNNPWWYTVAWVAVGVAATVVLNMSVPR